MAQVVNKSIDVPYTNKLTGENGLLTIAWQSFFRSLYNSISSLGTEISFELENNKSTFLNIEGLQFNSQKVNCVFVDFIIQRVTEGFSRVELIESGTFKLVFRPYDKVWVLNLPSSHWPDDSGVTLAVTDDGQMQYKTTNVLGIPRLSKITYRARTLAARYS